MRTHTIVPTQENISKFINRCFEYRDEENPHTDSLLSGSERTTRVRRIRLKNLFASKRIEANLDLIRLIFACFIFFATLIYSLRSLIFAYKYSLQFASKYALWSTVAHCLLPTVSAHCLLASTYCPLSTVHCLLHTVYRPLFTAHFLGQCLLSIV